MSQNILSIFSFRSFCDFSCYILVFKTFWVIFIHAVRKISSFILLHVAVQFAQNLLIEESVFAPTVYSCLFCHRLIDHRCMGLFWFYFVPFIYVCFCVSTIQFWITVTVYHIFTSESVVFSTFLLFSQNCFGCWGLLWFHTNFRIIFSSSMKNAMGNLMRIALNL